MSSSSSSSSKQKAIDPSRLSAFFDANDQGLTSDRTDCFLSEMNSQSRGERSILGGSKTNFLNARRDISGGIFGTCSIASPVLPQSDAEKIYDAAPHASKSERTYLALKNETVVTGGVAVPRPYLRSTPEILRSDVLMRPQERRALMHYEIEKRKAKKLQRTANANAWRMRRLVSCRYPAGILLSGRNGSDASVKKDDVYAPNRRKISQQIEKRDRSLRMRQEAMKMNENGVARRGYDILQHSTDPHGAAKATRTSTHDRLFPNSMSAKKVIGARAQARRDYIHAKDRGGRAFSIISGKAW